VSSSGILYPFPENQLDNTHKVEMYNEDVTAARGGGGGRGT
jgi:hypothetical protein